MPYCKVYGCCLKQIFLVVCFFILFYIIGQNYLNMFKLLSQYAVYLAKVRGCSSMRRHLSMVRLLTVVPLHLITILRLYLLCF